LRDVGWRQPVTGLQPASREVALPFRDHRETLAPVSVRRSLPALFPHGLGSEVFTSRPPPKLREARGCLSWAWAPLQSPPDLKPPPDALGDRAHLPPAGDSATSSLEVSSPSAYPRPGQRHRVVGFASPDRLRLQVFSTSWRLDPPRACRPCFMPDPLMGFALQSFPPPAQPYAVTGAAPLMALSSPAEPSRPRPGEVADT